MSFAFEADGIEDNVNHKGSVRSLLDLILLIRQARKHSYVDFAIS